MGDILQLPNEGQRLLRNLAKEGQLECCAVLHTTSDGDVFFTHNFDDIKEMLRLMDKATKALGGKNDNGCTNKKGDK